MRRSRMLAVGIVLGCAAFGCTSDDSSPESQSGSATTTTVAASEAALRSRCESLSAEPYRHHCGSLVDFALEQTEEHGCPEGSAFAFSERYAIDSYVSGPSADFFEKCPIPLESLLVSETIEGFTGLGEDQPETGVQTLDDYSAIFPRQREQVHDLMLEADLQAVVLGHWVRDSLRESSLVIRLEMFPDVDSARRWTTPPADDAGEPVDGVDDARLTVRDNDTGAGTDYTSLPHEQLAFGRACSVAVTVFVRSRSGAAPTDEAVLQVFHDQVDRVESSCESLGTSDV